MTKLEITVPTDRSTLSVLANEDTKKMMEGDTYREDGFVYHNDVRLRKWFAYRQGWNHYWEPIINQLSRLESLYYQLSLREQKKWKKISGILAEIVASDKTTSQWGEEKHCAHAKVSHTGNYHKPGWWVYWVSPSTFVSGPGLCFSFDWLDKEPEEKINLELGQDLYRLSFRSGNFIGRLDKLLDEAIIKHIRAIMPLPKFQADDDRYDVIINGRSYVYRARLNRYDYPEITKVFWPGERVYTSKVE